MACSATGQAHVHTHLRSRVAQLLQRGIGPHSPRFRGDSSGRECTQNRTQLVDKLLFSCGCSSQSCTPVHRLRHGCARAATDDGRSTRTPTLICSFCARTRGCAARAKDPVRSVCQELWDTGLRVSPTTRTIEDCGRFDHDNVEFTISLLDCRFLAGDENSVHATARKSSAAVGGARIGHADPGLAEVTNTRHAKFGKTIFHLEPNLKDGPGGLRDFHVTRWIALINELAARRAWPESLHLQQDPDDDVFAAMEFLSSARCYLHYRSGRDENVISWESQEELAARGVGSQRRSGVVGGVDAAVLPQCQCRLSQRVATAGPGDGDEFGAGAVVPALEIGRVERRIFCGGPASLHPAVGGRARCGSRVAPVYLHGAARCEAGDGNRASHQQRAPRRYKTPCRRTPGCGRICASCWCSPTRLTHCGPCIRCDCWCWHCRSLRPLSRWCCAISITATRLMSIRF